jgi:hypothetical protein
MGLGHAEQPVFGTRCAGPFAADLAGALPQRTIGLARLRRGHLTVDLSGSMPFAAGGFAGTVDSTVTLALRRPRTQPQHVTPPPGSTPIRITTVRYRITQSSGQATTTVRASSALAGCSPLDACGLQGTISVVPGAGSGTSAFLTATSRTRRSERDLLTALGIDSGGDTSGISVGGAGEVGKGGSVTATLTQDGEQCTDHVALNQTGIQLRKRRGRLVISVSPARSQAADPLRTRCPGPALGHHPLTSESLPLSVLRHRRFQRQAARQRVSRRPLRRDDTLHAHRQPPARASHNAGPTFRIPPTSLARPQQRLSTLVLLRMSSRGRGSRCIPGS